MPDYQKGRIYAIRAPGCDSVYIGSTCEELSRRKTEHKCAYRRYVENSGPFITSFDIIKHEGWYLELIEYYPCNTKEELNAREGQIIRQTSNAVNKTIPRRTDAEWVRDNKEKVDGYKKKYRDTHREERNKADRERYAMKKNAKENPGNL